MTKPIRSAATSRETPAATSAAFASLRLIRVSASAFASAFAASRIASRSGASSSSPPFDLPDGFGLRASSSSRLSLRMLARFDLTEPPAFVRRSVAFLS